MTNKNAKVLNEVTKVLIDSYKGYEKCYEISEDSFVLRNQFQTRANDRKQLINEFQAQVRAYGEEPEDDGTAVGALHRGWTNLTTVFQDDEKAAMEAIDDGEEYLRERIESKLDDDELTAETRALLSRAHQAAAAGERWADCLTD